MPVPRQREEGKHSLFTGNLVCDVRVRFRRDASKNSHRLFVLALGSRVCKLPDEVRCRFSKRQNILADVELQYKCAALGRNSATPLSIPLHWSLITVRGVSRMPRALARCLTKNRHDSFVSEGANPRAMGKICPAPSIPVATRTTPL